MFLVAVRGFSLQSLVSAGNAELGACLFSAILHVGTKRAVLLCKCLRPVKGDTVDAALRG